MPKPSVAIRLGTEGKAQVKNDFAEVGASGEASAKRLGDAFDRENARAERARQNMAATAAKIAAISPQTAVQMRINDSVGTGYSQPEGSARRAAQAFVEAEKAEAAFEARTRALLTAIDPAWAAQDRYNREIAEAKTLLDAGRISTDQYTQAQTRAKTALDGSTAAARRNAQMNGEVRQGAQQLAFNLGDISTQYVQGTKASMIFAQQSGQVIQAISLMAGGAGRFATFMGGPWGLAMTAGTLLLIPLVSKLFEGETAMKAVTLAADATGQAQSTLGQMYDLTTGKIKSQNDMLRLNNQLLAINLRAEAAKKEASAKTALDDAGSGRPAMFDFSRGLFVSGRQEADNRQRARTVQSWVKQYREGTLSASDAARVSESFDFRGLKLTREEFLQALADDATARSNRDVADRIDNSLSTGTLDPSLRQDTKPKPTPKPKVDRRAETLARESEATESLILNLGKLADAYLDSEAAALKAEIVAKATEQGIKKQADVTAYVAQQERKFVAERTADAAKLVAGMRIESTARELVNEQVKRGQMTAEQADRWLRNEAQVRPLIAAAALAEGEAKKKLLDIIKQIRAEQDRSTDNQTKEAAGRIIADQQDALAYADAEAGLVGKSATERNRKLDMLRLEQQLKRQGIELESEEGQQIVANQKLLQQKNEMIAAANRDWEEVTRIGENFIDTVLNPDNWDNWGDLGKKVIRDLMNEMIMLAAINPIKNALFGSELPVMGGVFGQVGKIGGGKSAGVAAGENDRIDGILGIGRIFGFAAGTHYFGGGYADVGEFGPERVLLPTGSRIMTAGDTRRSMGGGVNVSIPITIDATGADAAELARVEQKLDQLQRSLPGQIVSTVNDAGQRGYLRR